MTPDTTLSPGEARQRLADRGGVPAMAIVATDVDPVDEAGAVWHKLAVEHRQLATSIREATSTQRRNQAAQADADALGEAILTGAADPGNAHQDELARDVAELRRRRAGVNVAAARAAAAYRQAWNEQRAALQTVAARRLDAARAAVTASLDQLAAAAADLGEAEQVAAFAAGGPDQRLPAPGVLLHMGDRHVDVDDLVAALRARAERPTALEQAPTYLDEQHTVTAKPNVKRTSRSRAGSADSITPEVYVQPADVTDDDED